MIRLRVKEEENCMSTEILIVFGYMSISVDYIAITVTVLSCYF